VHPKLRFLALACLAIALSPSWVAAQAPAPPLFNYMTALHPLQHDCGEQPNTFGNAIFIYYIGDVIHFQLTIAPGDDHPITGGTLEWDVDDDNLTLICDPGSITLPPGAVLTTCDPGPGPPADGYFRVDNISIPDENSVTIEVTTSGTPTR